MKFKIEIDGQEKRINRHVQKIDIVDKIGTEADELSLTLSDYENRLEVPATGVEIGIYMGEADLIYIGKYKIDQISYSGTPDTLEIRGSGIAFDTPLNETAQISYHEKDLAGIVKDTADFYGLEAKIHNYFASVQIEHIDQNETGLAFLTRLARDYGAVFSVKDGLIIFSKKGEKTNGTAVDKIQIERRQVQNYRFNIADRNKSITGVKAFYLEEGEQKEFLAGESGYCENLAPVYKTEAEAKSKAAARFEQLSGLKGSCSLSLAEPKLELTAGLELELKGFKDIFCQGRWLIKEVRQSLSSESGLQTSLELESS